MFSTTIIYRKKYGYSNLQIVQYFVCFDFRFYSKNEIKEIDKCKINKINHWS